MRILSALFLSATLMAPLPALAQEASPALVTANGTGTVAVVPDIASLSIGVTTTADTAAAALTANNLAVEAVMARLSASGIETRDMQTSNLYLNPNWTGYDSSTPTISGYTASNMLTVQVRQLDQLGAVLDAAVSDGANTLNGVTFGMADPEPALNQARGEAVADARARAELLAAAAGMKLGRVVSISEMSNPMAGYDIYAMEAASTPVPVAGGELGLTASVTVTYEIVE